MIFVFLGLSAVSRNHEFNFPFIVITIALLVVTRFIVISALTAIINAFRLDKIQPVDQFIMAYGGLRGAESFGLVMSLNAALIPHKAMFTTTTIIVVFFTVFVQVGQKHPNPIWRLLAKGNMMGLVQSPPQNVPSGASPDMATIRKDGSMLCHHFSQAIVDPHPTR